MRKFSMILVAIFIAIQLHSIDAIFHGEQATPNQFPYAVLLHSPRFFCSGTLISDRHVLTAAHCLMSIKPGQRAIVHVGAYEYFGDKKSDGKTLFSDKFWIHENFTMPSAVFDIGLIELPERLVSSEKIQWRKLSTKLDADLDAEDKEIMLAGWGYTENSKTIAKKLRYTKMELLPLIICQTYKSHYIEDMNDDHICAEKVVGMPCDGDSGSAIISTKTNKLVGVLSYVKDAKDGVDLHYNDCVSKVPAVSTRISSYIDWISEKTGINFRSDRNQSSENTIDIDNENVISNEIRNGKSARWRWRL